MRPRIADYIDERNEIIWKEVTAAYEVDLKFFNEKSHLCYTQGKTAIIYIPHHEFCKDSFMHELLHIYLKVKGVNPGPNLELSIKYHPLLSNTYSNGLIEHMSNCMDHYKMLPIYLSKGYQRNKFISDHFIYKCKSEEIEWIRMFWSSTLLWKEVADLYVGKFFAMKACSNNEFDYSGFFDDLSNVDVSLYKLLDDFWAAWEGLDIENIDPVFNNDRMIVNQFIRDLTEWTETKEKLMN